MRNRPIDVVRDRQTSEFTGPSVFGDSIYKGNFPIICLLNIFLMYNF